MSLSFRTSCCCLTIPLSYWKLFLSTSCIFGTQSQKFRHQCSGKYEGYEVYVMLKASVQIQYKNLTADPTSHMYDM